MSTANQPELLGLENQELTVIFRRIGEPGYRGQQLFEALYRQRAATLDEVTTLPQRVRAKLAEDYRVGLPVIDKKFESVDGTIRYLLQLGDGQTVETVWMPEGDGGDIDSETEGRPFDRATICVSSQVGCAVNCQFCLTARLGIVRNLSAGEIVGQILSVLKDRDASPVGERINIVFMGMGEPFLNYDNFMKAVRLLVDGVGIAESRMTVSTAGIIPRIEDFGKESVRPKLAISLNGSNDDIRESVMPINRKWNLAHLTEAARQFPLRPRERLTFEYVLLDRVNDSPENAREVVRLLYGIRAKVNLIALNPGPDIPFSSPSQDRVLAFQRVLVDAGIPTFIRRPRGRDIYAACGQLKRTTELVQLPA